MYSTFSRLKEMARETEEQRDAFNVKEKDNAEKYMDNRNNIKDFPFQFE